MPHTFLILIVWFLLRLLLCCCEILCNMREGPIGNEPIAVFHLKNGNSVHSNKKNQSRHITKGTKNLSVLVNHIVILHFSFLFTSPVLYYRLASYSIDIKVLCAIQNEKKNVKRKMSKKRKILVELNWTSIYSIIYKANNLYLYHSRVAAITAGGGAGAVADIITIAAVLPTFATTIIYCVWWLY